MSYKQEPYDPLGLLTIENQFILLLKEDTIQNKWEQLVYVRKKSACFDKLKEASDFFNQRKYELSKAKLSEALLCVNGKDSLLMMNDMIHHLSWLSNNYPR